MVKCVNVDKVTKKTPVLLARPTQILHFGRFFFFLIFPKSCKISHFLTKIWKFLKYVNIFSQNFSVKNVRFFPKFSCFQGHFCYQKFKKKKKKRYARPTDPTWQVHPPVKHFFFFFCGLTFKHLDFCTIWHWQWHAISWCSAWVQHIFHFGLHMYPLWDMFTHKFQF